MAGDLDGLDAIMLTDDPALLRRVLDNRLKIAYEVMNEMVAEEVFFAGPPATKDRIMEEARRRWESQ